ncbi:MAG: ATP-binding protein [bacterium]|nr:ATP-binding protein [bacterium]
MFSMIREKYFGKDLPTEVRVFNTNHVIIIASLFVATILSMIFMPQTKAALLLIGTMSLGIITFFEANRTGRFTSCSVVMSLVVNFLLIPSVYFCYNSLTCCIPIYGVLGIVYTILLIHGKWGFIIVAIEVVWQLCLFAAGYRYLEFHPDVYSLKDSIGVMIGVILAGLFAGLEIKYKLTLYNQEQKNAEAAHLEAMDAYIAKDMFLINMSHEIRTPMNAILGTTEMLLDYDINEHVRDNVYSILNSCNALLTITDDMLDLTKTETTNVKIFNTEYDLTEVLSDIVNMMSVRLMDSEVDFFVDIDMDIPYLLYGDGSRLRQVFINLLNNAVKYTKFGSIILRVTFERKEDQKIMLKADIADTGIGIKEEDIPKLFGSYQRMDEGKAENRKIEGTGLGLAISQEIVEQMGGKITVQSKYRVGSTFSFSVCQTMMTEVPVVHLEYAGKPEILVFEENETCQSVLADIFQRMEYKALYAQNKVMFENLLEDHQFTHIFIALERYEEVSKLLFKYVTTESVVIIAAVNQIPSVDQFGCILTRPLHCINVAAVFSNEKNKSVRDVIKKGGFVCPDANILVVDDNITNLNVVSGLLKKYESRVLMANSGAECLNIVSSEHVDLIFLDYMMPEMDGIDTLMKIKEMNREDINQIHIIALTANVVSGAREMFMEAGFDDYISKPIETDRMEHALRMHLPKNLIVGRNLLS